MHHGTFLRLIRLAFAATALGCSSSSSPVDANGGDAAGGQDAGEQGDAIVTDSGGGGGDAATTPDGSSAGLDATSDAPKGGGHHDGAASPDGSLGKGGLAYLVGIKTNGFPTGPATVEGWLGRPLDVAGTTINTNSYIGTGTPYTTASGAHPLLEVSFPLLSIFGENNGMTDMAQAASGAYDATYEAMAEALASWANPLLSARIGWEFNGNWYQWSNGVGTNATYANFVAAFKRAAALIRKHNPNVLIQWCIAWGQPDPTPYWPGAYDATNNPGGVDVVSMDFYQANISQFNNGGNTSTWQLAQSGVTIDLDWMVSFAQSKGVKVALSEYGAGSSQASKGQGSGHGLDDGTWTAASIAWMNSLPEGLFLWANWSDDAPADDIATAGANPNEQAAWKAAWAGTHFAGSWWTGTTPP